MNEKVSSFREQIAEEIVSSERACGPFFLRKSVFSRFCQCGANVTIGLITDDGYAIVEDKWNSLHTGAGHEVISRHEWLTMKLTPQA